MTGSLQEKNGRYYMVLELGKGKQKWKSTGLKVQGNKRKAEKMLTDTIRDYEEKLAAQPENDMTMPELIREWLATKKREIRGNSYTSYEETAVNHIIPYFEQLEFTVTQLTSAHIQRYYAAKSVEGLTPGSLTRHRTIIRGSLDYAIQTLDIINVNAADRAKLPKNCKKRVPTYYTAEQLKRLFREAEGESIEAPVRLSATYGLRRSEALGLRWSAVDWQRKTVTICHTVVRDGSNRQIGNEPATT